MLVRRLATVALAAGLLPTVHAQAAPATGPDGPKCGFLGWTDYAFESDGDDVFGYLVAGPLLVTVEGSLGQGRVHCSLQTGNGSSTHAAQDATLAVTTTDETVVVMDGEPVAFDEVDDVVYLCTRFTFSTGEIFYWDGSTHEWSTSSAVPCNDVRREDTTTSRPEDVTTSVCPYFSYVPFFEGTLRHLLSCNTAPPPSGTNVVYVAVPDL